MNRCLLTVALLAGCQHRDNEVREPPAVATQPAAEPAADGISGRVVETMDASTYTYARLESQGGEIWVAGPKTQLAVGTRLTRLEGQLMTDFHSNTLDRTFGKIYFVTAFGPRAATPAAAPAAPADAKSEGITGTIVQTMDAGGYTYAELDQNGAKVWIAGPTTKVAVGTKLAKMTGTLMTDFHSSTLNRTFDRIYFVGSIAN